MYICPQVCDYVLFILQDLHSITAAKQYVNKNVHNVYTYQFHITQLTTLLFPREVCTITAYTVQMILKG